jgi:hypothetical protein
MREEDRNEAGALGRGVEGIAQVNQAFSSEQRTLTSQVNNFLFFVFLFDFVH